MTATVLYEGELHTTCVHLHSGTQINTDAPKDNQGKGEAFSPTDLTATSLAACILTTMAIKARTMDIELSGTKAEVTKVMYAEPRRIGEIIVQLTFPTISLTEKDKKILEHTAKTCPVSLSLHPEVKQVIEFIYP